MTPLVQVLERTASSGADDGELAALWQGGDRQAGRGVDRPPPCPGSGPSSRPGAATPPRPTILPRRFFWQFVRVCHTYDRGFAFTGWLYGIARNKLADFWRKHHALDSSDASAEPFEHRSPATIHEEAEEAAAAWKEVFARLPEPQASALWLRVQEELSLEEIARTMDVSLANAKVLLFRARQTLTPFFKNRINTP